jgi:hypothetical protein
MRKTQSHLRMLITQDHQNHHHNTTIFSQQSYASINSSPAPPLQTASSNGGVEIHFVG